MATSLRYLGVVTPNLVANIGLTSVKITLQISAKSKIQECLKVFGKLIRRITFQKVNIKQRGAIVTIPWRNIYSI